MAAITDYSQYGFSLKAGSVVKARVNISTIYGSTFAETNSSSKSVIVMNKP
jgi:hypothetical protein